ncbi:MAG: sulfotransferase, partial [Alcanivorax nanhaiticus]
YCRIGHILSSSGRIDEAEQSYLQALDQQPNNVAAISGLATIKKNSLAFEYVERANRLLENTELPDGHKASLHNALSYYYYGQKNHALAAQHMAEANHFQWVSKSRQGWRYDPLDYQNTIKRLKQDFSPNAIAQHKGFGNSSTLPVFIVGMPRSGTTLTEQILARHPAVLGVGERNFAGTALNAYQNLYAQKFKISLEAAARKCIAEPDAEVLEMVAQEYLRALNDQIMKSGKPDIQYVVDKMPDNYQNVGWLKLLFPNAHIIHARRDMRDVAMSCWQTQFGSIRWACHTEHLLARFECYADLMEHWNTVFPDSYLETDYESLVADQEGGSRRLIEFIGLPWDELCLKFYESDRLVRTASITQVRQPIYKSSVAKWTPYEELIPELIKPLGQLMHQYRW